MNMNKKIKYIYDKNGKEKEVIIPFREWTSIMEDLTDLRTIELRRKEKNVPLKLIKEHLKRHA
jgi:PHD/YefM family antitoxin component YafN of YafNO toxin-antitoxin module